MRIAVDWDDTLVDVTTKKWLPGAERALADMVRVGHTVIIHSCRAGWPEGRAEIEAALKDAHLLRHVEIAEKPSADVYIDDRAMKFEGDWGSAWLSLRPPRKRKLGKYTRHGWVPA